jgi:hypothetical protein
MLLSTDLWVSALIRRAEQAGAFATVLRKGDSKAGAVLVKVVDRRAGVSRLYAQALTGFGDMASGETTWMQPVASAEEMALDAYAERAARIDPDVWVVEIDDVQGRSFLTEPVENR